MLEKKVCPAFIKTPFWNCRVNIIVFDQSQLYYLCQSELASTSLCAARGFYTKIRRAAHSFIWHMWQGEGICPNSMKFCKVQGRCLLHADWMHSVHQSRKHKAPHFTKLEEQRDFQGNNLDARLSIALPSCAHGEPKQRFRARLFIKALNTCGRYLPRC